MAGGEAWRKLKISDLKTKCWPCEPCDFSWRWPCGLFQFRRIHSLGSKSQIPVGIDIIWHHWPLKVLQCLDITRTWVLSCESCGIRSSRWMRIRMGLWKGLSPQGFVAVRDFISIILWNQGRGFNIEPRNPCTNHHKHLEFCHILTYSDFHVSHCFTLFHIVSQDGLLHRYGQSGTHLVYTRRVSQSFWISLDHPASSRATAGWTIVIYSDSGGNRWTEAMYKAYQSMGTFTIWFIWSWNRVNPKSAALPVSGGLTLTEGCSLLYIWFNFEGYVTYVASWHPGRPFGDDLGRPTELTLNTELFHFAPPLFLFQNAKFCSLDRLTDPQGVYVPWATRAKRFRNLNDFSNFRRLLLIPDTSGYSGRNQMESDSPAWVTESSRLGHHENHETMDRNGSKTNS